MYREPIALGTIAVLRIFQNTEGMSHAKVGHQLGISRYHHGKKDYCPLRARDLGGKCIGTSAAVLPAVDIPRLAKTHGASVVEIYLEETSLIRTVSYYAILRPCSTTISEIAGRVRAKKE